MAQLCYSNSKKYSYRSEDDYYESNQAAERQKVETIRRYISKQLHSPLKIEDCLSNREKFTTSETQKDVIHNGKGGLASLTDFKNICNAEDIKDALTESQLTENEIDLLFHDTLKKNVHPDAYIQKLKIINEKLLTREKNLLQDDLSTERLKIESPLVPRDHPINFLQQLEASLFPQLVKETSPNEQQATFYHRRKRKRESISLSSAPQNDAVGSGDRKSVNKRATLWDVKEIGIKPLSADLKESFVESNKHCSAVSETSKFSSGNIKLVFGKTDSAVPDFSKPFVWTMDKSQLTPVSVIDQNKISISVIKQDEKFKNYNCGFPSRTLYIKNLPRAVSPEKLISVFGNFEPENGPKIEYRILNGKMKGQAFVKFNTIETSSLALSVCNGFFIDGKPIVIEYGRS